jgi:hypothetical protein
MRDERQRPVIVERERGQRITRPDRVEQLVEMCVGGRSPQAVSAAATLVDLPVFQYLDRRSVD